MSLLPSSAEPFELAVEETHRGRWDSMNAAVPAITTAKENPPPSFLPFLVWEYGLGMLTPYVGNLYNLINEGVAWERVRGTYAGVRRGLAFINVTATVEPAWHGRVWWNSAQLRFPELPANDNPLLENIEGITRLSLPFRSDLRRGVFQYDVPAAEADGTALDEAHLEEESGIRLKAGGTLWSFGRTTEFDHLLTEEEGTLIGNWLEIPDEGGIPWVSMTYPWVTATFKWADNPEAQRRSLMAAWFEDREIFVAFRDADDEVIGYRRARACRPVTPIFGGVYSLAGQPYAPQSGGQRVYLEAMTDFEENFDVTATSIALIANANRASGVPAGRLWLAPSELSGGQAFAEKAVSIPLRKTVRERIKFIVRF